ncbi:molybdopterin-dependent oxidoreductase [Anoxybacterium hadale]|uniref:Molybdopterin-dependent oxidoreductase n=1 Tax=Anoxybacterium hadale TaxID=3408580 RepID=A0ACD1A8N5_9FIRM|nr:molybdopterin-dependent oxidoreductase [Clostridiales bacterium]
MIRKTLFVNGVERHLIVDPDESLLNVLRNQLFLIGTKSGCGGEGECGACTVIWDGKAVRSCNYKMERIPDGAQIVTIEGVGTKECLHPLQLSWMIHGGAQCGFCTPGFIVSAKALLDQNQNPTREEVREWFQVNRNICRCTGYKPLVDAVMDAARLVRGEVTKEELWPKLKDGVSLMGSSMPRPSALAKVTGTWDFGADSGRKLPEGALHIKLVQAKVSHANILNIDTSEAEKMPGVYQVITYKDVPGTNRINGLAFPANKGSGKERPILNDKKIFQFGDALAMVLAYSPKIAEEAAKKVKVEIEELPAYMNALDAMDEDAIEIHPGTPNVYFENHNIKGEEVEPLFEELPFVVEDDFYVGRQPHLPLEPDVGYAYIDEEGKLVIHSKSIGLQLHALMVAEGIGVPLDQLVIVQNNAGGTFGYKFSPTMEGLLGVAAMVTKKPVFLEFNMYQQITYTGKRSPFFINVKMGADENGKIKAMASDWTVDHGPYCEFGDLLTMRAPQFIGAGYNIPNIRGNGRTVATNHAWGSAFRGYGSPQSLFSSEVLVDELAVKAGMDPLEFRYLNVYRQGDTTPTGCEPDVIAFPQALEKLRPIYKKAKESAKAKNARGGDLKYGVGISLLEYGCGLDGADSSEAWAEITEKGISIGSCWEDHGQGADMGFLSVAHEGLKPLGIKPEQIRLVMNDTEKAPNSGPAGGSRSTVMTGNATRVACENLVAALKKDDGTYRSYQEMIDEGLPTKYMGSWTAPCTACSVETGQGNPFPVYMYGVLLAEVSVDTISGKVKIEKLTLVSDCGPILNKLVLEGQLWGGLTQGIGLALSEDFEDLNKHTTLVKCGIPRIMDVPDNMEIIHQETPRPYGPFGLAGSGEMPLSAPHAAIVNAIYNACGVRITKLPARPEKILAAL